MAEASQPDDVLVAYGDACSTLTPEIKTRLNGLRSGDLLEVQTDDPAARETMSAWSRLTGNEIVRVEEGEQGKTTFQVRKK